jgi:alkylhydroperoxidase family enzyme
MASKDPSDMIRPHAARGRLASLTLLTLALAGADDPPASSRTQPAPVPVTRKAMKQALEYSKHNVPRLPLPELTDEQKARAEEAARARATESGRPAASGLGGGIVNNGRMRSHYLADYGPGGSLGSRPAAGQTGAGRDAARPAAGSPTDQAFQTMLFWIVSRGNNCTYCMGHQESKLSAAGLSDDQIAALDSNWEIYTPAQQAAFAFAKKATYEPHTLTDADIAALKAHFDDAAITEMLVAIGGFNAMNRWTGSLRIPQEGHRDYLTPTTESYASAVSEVAPVGAAGADVEFVAPTARTRPPLESKAEVDAALAQARARTPRLKLADASATREALGDAVDAGSPLPAWVRLLATTPRGGGGRVTSHLAAETKGQLDPRTKAIIAYVAARNDRAWYALDLARQRLHAQGLTDAQIDALDAPESLPSDADRQVVHFARILTVDPAQITDADFDRVKAHFDDQRVAEIVHQATEAAFFDRVTEAAGLPLEPETSDASNN